MKNDFFLFRSKSVTTTVQAHSVGLKKDEFGINENSKLIEGLYQGINLPVKFQQRFGKKFTDVLGTGWSSLYLISDHMRMVLNENCLTGWKTFPIELYSKKGDEIAGYSGFSIIGHSGPTTFENSEIIEERLVPNGPLCKFYKGMFIESWDGSDFFIPENTFHIIISKKAADVLKKNKITNVEITSTSEYEKSI